MTTFLDSQPGAQQAGSDDYMSDDAYYRLIIKNIGVDLDSAPDSFRLTKGQAAAYVGMGEANFDRHRRNKTINIPHYKVGRSIFYLLGDLRAYLAQCRQGGAA